MGGLGPHAGEAARIHPCIADGVHDLHVAHVFLDQADVQAFVRKVIARGVLQHMRVDLTAKARSRPRLPHDVPDPVTGRGSTALGHEDVIAHAVRRAIAELGQHLELVLRQRMNV